MDQYGIDRPDLRFGVQLFNLSEVVKDSGFGVFKNAVSSGGQVKGLVYPGGANVARREIDELTEYVKQYGAKGLAWIGVTGAAGSDGFYGEEALRSQIAKFFGPQELASIIQTSGAQAGDLILIVADKPSVVAQSLCNLRL
jgi:aspartyl-tRNA synthetase